MRHVRVAHVSGILRHVDFGETAAIVKVGSAAGDEQLGFGGGLAALVGGQLTKGQGGLAARGVGGDSFLCGLLRGRCAGGRLDARAQAAAAAVAVGLARTGGRWEIQRRHGGHVMEVWW